MNDTAHPDPLGHAADGVTPASEALIEQRERVRTAYRELEEAHMLVLGLMGGHLHAFLKVGDAIKRGDRDETMLLRVQRGRDYGATRFEILELPRVHLQADRDPIGATWVASAFPLNDEGRRMGGFPVTVEAPLFPMPDPGDKVGADEYEAFCDAFVDNWMCSTPESYQRLKPSQFTATQE